LQGHVEVKYLTDSHEHFPPGLQPAFALKDGCLVLASSPDVVLGFGTAPGATANRADSQVPLLRLSVREITRYLKERQDVLVAYISKKKQLPNEMVAQGLTSLLAGLELLDAIEISQRSDPGRVILSLRVRPTQPLK